MHARSRRRAPVSFWVVRDLTGLRDTPMLLRALLIALAAASAAGAGSGSASGSAASGSASVPWSTDLCRAYTMEGALAHLSSMGHNTTQAALVQYCLFTVCRAGAQADYKVSCQAGIDHGFVSHFREEQVQRPSLNWAIIFLVTCTLCGAAFSVCFPVWLPYTVGLLVVGVVLGILSQALAGQQDCPHFALLSSDENHDGLISRDEWNHFICAGCVANSVCLSPASRTGAEFAGSCGDGTASPSGCRYTWEGLNAPWTSSSMLSETNQNTRRHLEAHGRQLASAGVDHSKYLTADELWTPACDLLPVWGPHTL